MVVTKSRPKLDIALSARGPNAFLKDGTYEIEGITSNFVKAEPMIGCYRRMVRELAFDVCEMAPTTYLIARSYGAPYVALPLFVTRKFHHSGLVCREDANIRTPKDLEGKKVGVRAYSVTTGVWTRGILMEEYGLDDKAVTWVVDDEEHVTQMTLPSNVVKVPDGKSLVGMMAAGEIQAGFTARAGIGREGPPVEGWEEAGKKPLPQIYHELFDNAAELEADWYKRTGIYPMHGVIVVKEDVLKEHPEVAQAIYSAYIKAHDDWLQKLHAGDLDNDRDKGYRKLIPVVGDDPLPYGIEANLPSIQAIHDYSYKQGLLAKKLSLSDMYLDPTA